MQPSFSNVDKRFKRTAAWATIGTASQVLSQTVAIVVLARLLNPYEFGVVSAAALVTQLSLIFLEFGIGPYVVQRAELTPVFLGTAFAMSCSLGILMATLLWCGAPLFASLLHVPELSLALRAYAAVFLMASICAVHEALIQRDLDFKYLARADAASFGLGYAAISILCALLGFSYWSLIIGHFSQSLIRCIIVRVRHPQVATYPASFNEARLIARFGSGQTLSRLASFIASQADGFIVTTKLGVTSIGHYGRANQLVTMPAAQLGQIFDKLIFPLIARVQDQQGRAAATYRAAITGICVLSLPVSALFWILGEKIVHVALGQQWSAVAQPMQILALAIPFRLIHKVSDPTARAFGKTYSRAWRQWLVAAAVSGLTLAFIKYGLSAVAWGVVVAAALDATLMVWLCCAVTKLPITDLLRALLPGIQLGVVVALVASVVLFMTQPWCKNDLLTLVVVSAISAGVAVALTYRYGQRLTNVQP